MKYVHKITKYYHIVVNLWEGTMESRAAKFAFSEMALVSLWSVDFVGSKSGAS